VLDYQTELKKKILKENKHEDHKIVKVRRVKRPQCQMVADPHVHGFNNKNYDAQTEGDWVLYRGLNLKVHYRGKRFGGWVGAVQYGIRLFGQRISSRGVNSNVVNIDGVDTNINGKINLPRGGFIKKSGIRITYGTSDGEEVDFDAHGTYYNVYLRSSVPDVSGLCSQQFVRSSFFRNPIIGEIDNIRVGKCHKRSHFRRKCERLGLRGKKIT